VGRARGERLRAERVELGRGKQQSGPKPEQADSKMRLLTAVQNPCTIHNADTFITIVAKLDAASSVVPMWPTDTTCSHTTSSALAPAGKTSERAVAYCYNL
jgi:hypothetical protein